MATDSTAVDFDATRRECESVHAYLSQNQMWKPKGRPALQITAMDEAWRFNAARWLERQAAIFEFRFTVGEIFAMGNPAIRDVQGAHLSRFDLMGDLARDAFDEEVHARNADPESWIRTTPLHLALTADLPTGDALDELVERASHWSTCPARTGAVADCDCHMPECPIRNGDPELGCTCRGTSPERTDD